MSLVGLEAIAESRSSLLVSDLEPGRLILAASLALGRWGLAREGNSFHQSLVLKVAVIEKGPLGVQKSGSNARDSKFRLAC
jgi:hypothetical protein